MSKIEIRKVGITEIPVDAVVNAANEGLWAGSGVCGAIFRAAGHKKLKDACDAIGHCDTGSAVITPAFNLDAKYIIHAVGPQWDGGTHREPQLLYNAYRASLDLARANGCKSIAFPLLSAGIYGYPISGAWNIALMACRDFLAAHPGALDITFAVIDDRIMAVGLEKLVAIQKT